MLAGFFPQAFTDYVLYFVDYSWVNIFTSGKDFEKIISDKPGQAYGGLGGKFGPLHQWHVPLFDIHRPVDNMVQGLLSYLGTVVGQQYRDVIFITGIDYRVTNGFANLAAT